MINKNSKDLFAAAVSEGIQRANEINAKINRIIDIINDASDAVNNVHDDIIITSSTSGDSLYIKISAFVNYQEDLASRRIMDIEIFKERGNEIVVSTKRGKTTISSEEEIVQILLDILSSPTFWSGIEEMRKRG
ncbi:hypothetical protein ACIPT4_10390 [Pectobacterium jejuense]|uniref:hypothetical protein n=1 Tax=Pectobacterium TaxID=122277 RepID=UPI001CC467BA|nr:hypothetical protein [Pectobacterium polaris]UAY91179.1 hypothetical protein KSL88_16960 [Pectobacterium polaris]